MGVSVREKIKGSGVWWVFVKHQGKQYSKKIGQKRLAQKVAGKIQARLVLGEFNIDEPQETGAPVFRDYSKF